MTISVSGTFPSQSAYTSSAATPPPQEPQPSDQVTLSQSAQVSQLSQHGQTPSQIAVSLGISVSLVDLDLGIVATAAPTPAPAPSPKTAAPAHAEAAKPTASKASA